MPRPTSSIGTKTISGPESASRPASSTTVPARSASRPMRTISRGDTFGSSRGMPIAAMSSVIESGSSRAPVASADRPRQTERYSGTTKKKPACTRYWKKNISRPPLSWRLRRKPGRMSVSWPRDSPASLPALEEPEDERADQDEPDRRREPAHDGPPGFGWIQPHSLERRTPKTSAPRPGRGEDRADDVELRSRLGGSVRDLSRER